MKILLHYLKPYKWLIVLALVLAAINQVFSMLDPYFFGRLIDKYATHPFEQGILILRSNLYPKGLEHSLISFGEC